MSRPAREDDLPAGEDDPQPEPTFRELFAQEFAGRMSTAQDMARGLHDGSGMPSVMAAVGGRRGLLESVLPVTAFSVAWGITYDLRTSLVVALVPVLVFAVWRLVTRQSLMMVFGGLLGFALGAFLATRTGRAENFFVVSIIKNIGFAALCLLTIAIRWPIVGLVLGFFLGEQTAWRQVPARRRAYVLATWVWVGLFGIRVAAQVPLYLLHQATALGFVNVILGLPLYILTLYLNYVVVRRVPIVHVAAEEDARTHEPPVDGPALPELPPAELPPAELARRREAQVRRDVG